MSLALGQCQAPLTMSGFLLSNEPLDLGDTMLILVQRRGVRGLKAKWLRSVGGKDLPP